MSSVCRVNIKGAGNLLSAKKLEKISRIIIGSYWRLSIRPPLNFQVDVNLVSDNEIKEINRKFLGRDRLTDVIAFSLEEGEAFPREEVPLIGQIIISAETAKKQAGRYKNSFKEEIYLLIIHGLLHVAGWEEGEELQKCQDKIANHL